MVNNVTSVLKLCPWIGLWIIIICVTLFGRKDSFWSQQFPAPNQTKAHSHSQFSICKEERRHINIPQTLMYPHYFHLWNPKLLRNPVSSLRQVQNMYNFFSKFLYSFGPNDYFFIFWKHQLCRLFYTISNSIYLVASFIPLSPKQYTSNEKKNVFEFRSRFLLRRSNLLLQCTEQ